MCAKSIIQFIEPRTKSTNRSENLKKLFLRQKALIILVDVWLGRILHLFTTTDKNNLDADIIKDLETCASSTRDFFDYIESNSLEIQSHKTRVKASELFLITVFQS